MMVWVNEKSTQPGSFYLEQLTRYCFGDDVAKIKEAWDAGGSKAGIAAASGGVTQ